MNGVSEAVEDLLSHRGVGGVEDALTLLALQGAGGARDQPQVLQGEKVSMQRTCARRRQSLSDLEGAGLTW